MSCRAPAQPTPPRRCARIRPSSSTAIRRAFVPQQSLEAVVDALKAKLAKITVGNPRNDSVRMGSLVSRAQYDNVLAGIAMLREQAVLAYDGSATPLVDADPEVAACVAPHLL